MCNRKAKSWSPDVVVVYERDDNKMTKEGQDDGGDDDDDVKIPSFIKVNSKVLHK